MAYLRMRKNKLNNSITKVEGFKFQSKKEAQRYKELALLEKSGKIETLIMQPKFLVHDSFIDPWGNKHRKIVYKADFQYFDKTLGVTIVEDVKGFKTQVYKLKKKMFLNGRIPQGYLFREI